MASWMNSVGSCSVIKHVNQFYQLYVISKTFDRGLKDWVSFGLFKELDQR